MAIPAKFVRCLYKFEGGGDKLSFAEGDIIRVISESGTGWDSGEVANQMGWYPSTYVEPYEMTAEDLAEMEAESTSAVETGPENVPAPTADVESPAPSPAPTANHPPPEVKIDSNMRRAASAASMEADGNAIIFYEGRHAMVDHFWGQSAKGIQGWSLVLKHMEAGMESLSQAHTILIERAACDRSYAQSLKLLANTKRAAMLDKSLGEPMMEITFHAMNTEADIYMRSVNSVGLGSDLYSTVETFRGSLKILIHKYAVKVEKCRESKIRYRTLAEKQKQVYFKICRDVQIAGKLAEAKSRKKIDAAQKEYSESVKQGNIALQNEIDTLCEALEAFEAKDVDRIDLFQTIFQKYVEICNKKNQDLCTVLDKVPPLLATISAAKDVEAFVKENATGRHREGMNKEETYNPRDFEGQLTKKKKK